MEKYKTGLYSKKKYIVNITFMKLLSVCFIKFYQTFINFKV